MPIKGKNKILWFLVGNPRVVGSSRIHGLNVHNKLRSLGYNSVIAYTPLHIEEAIPFRVSATQKFDDILQEGDVVILQKIKDPINLPFIQLVKNRKARLVFIDCDLPLSLEVAGSADQVICTSVQLAAMYAKHGIEAKYLEDAPESFHLKDHYQQQGQLQCFWFGDGSEERWKDVVKLKQLISEEGGSNTWKLVTISNHPDADIKWTPAFLDELKRADAIAIPVFNDRTSSQVKSANRLLQSMALSIPVICSPLASYQQVATSWKDAVICETEEEWKNALARLKDGKLRKEIGQQAFATAKKYSLDNSIENWIAALGLGEGFKCAPRQNVQTQNRVHRFFYSQLLRNNIHYWKWEHFTLSNALRFLYLKLVNLTRKISNGHFLLRSG